MAKLTVAEDERIEEQQKEVLADKPAKIKEIPGNALADKPPMFESDEEGFEKEMVKMQKEEEKKKDLGEWKKRGKLI